MEMHPDFDSTRSTADVGTLFALWSDYSSSRKIRTDRLRISVKSISRNLDEAVSVRMPDSPDPALDLEIYLEPSMPH